MPYLVRDCVRCGVKRVQMTMNGFVATDGYNFELFMVCSNCNTSSIYSGQPDPNRLANNNLNLETEARPVDAYPVSVHPMLPEKNLDVPERVTDLFIQAAACRRYGLHEAAGAMFRKTIDVATKQIFKTDTRLSDKKPADALRNRINALGTFGILDNEIVEIADLAIVDGNDAAHDEDPYTSSEAEALEELTYDILERIFIRPAKIARIREKQIAAGSRKPEA